MGSSFLLANINGLGDVEANIQMQQAPYHDGATFVDSTLETRIITFEVMIVGKDDTDVSHKRSQLARIFNPKLGEGIIEYRYGDVVRIIDAVAESIPKFGAGFANRGFRHQKSLIDLVCPNPYWRSTFIAEEPIFEPMFQFPFEGDFQMGMQRDRRIIMNDGDSPAPLYVEFFGPAFVDANGNQRNVVNWIDLNSSFFKLEIGENDVEYTADSDIQGAVVNISYSKLYAAI